MNKLSIKSIIPNMTTLIGLCFGIIAICFALSGQFKLSVICIMMASICDVLDGRLSRLLKSESKLGAELDSLADFLNFGIAPSIVAIRLGETHFCQLVHYFGAGKCFG